MADLGVKEKMMEEAKPIFPVGHPSTGKDLDGKPHQPKGKPVKK